MKVALTHATGNRNVRHTLSAIQKVSSLSAFFTTLGWGGSSRVTSSWSGRMSARRYEVADTIVQRRLSREIVRLASRNVLPASLVKADGLFGIEAVCRDLDNWVARQMERSVDVHYLYLDQCSAQLEKAREIGTVSFLECHHALVVGVSPWVNRLQADFPEWVGSHGRLPLRQSQRESQRMQVQGADLVIAPSRQVVSSIKAAGREGRIEMVPYGCPRPGEAAVVKTPSGGRRPLRVAYVGRLAPLKGLPYLARAVAFADLPVELKLAGPLQVDERVVRKDFSSADYLGVLSSREVRELMLWADVFVMPSLVEGRSLAVLEALSLGTPCIVTPGSGVDDLVERGAGRVVDNADAVGLALALREFWQDDDLLVNSSLAAIEISAVSGWEAFETRLGALISEFARA